jgi:hypothetical protein
MVFYFEIIRKKLIPYKKIFKKYFCIFYPIFYMLIFLEAANYLSNYKKLLISTKIDASTSMVNFYYRIHRANSIHFCQIIQ